MSASVTASDPCVPPGRDGLGLSVRVAQAGLRDVGGLSRPRPASPDCMSLSRASPQLRPGTEPDLVFYLFLFHVSH